VPKRIFIVDDSRIVKQFVRTHLENQLPGVVCLEASNGLDAVKRASELGPDVIILDFSMPGLNGMQAAAVLHKMLPAVPIILYTFHEDVLSGAQVKAAGIRAVVSKTDPIGVLLGEVKSFAQIARSASA
jgi:DNA-binding NarL/FixJ family response regulator